MALPEITVEDLENVSNNATDNRQRLQKSLRAGQLNIVKALGAIQNTLQLMYDNAVEQIEAAKAREGAELEALREAARAEAAAAKDAGGEGKLKEGIKKTDSFIDRMLKSLKSLFIIGALGGLIAFLNSEYWPKLKTLFVETILPKLKWFFDFLFENFDAIAVAFSSIFIGILLVKWVILPLAKTVSAIIVASKAMAAAFVAVKGFLAGTAIWAKAVAAAKAIAAGFVAVKTFLAGTLLPAITAFMVPLLPIIAIVAAISVALWALWNAFWDAKDTFDETGSVTEALKVGISTFFGTLLGFIPDMVLKLVGWVAGLFGFDDFKAKVQTIDVTLWITTHIALLIDDIINWFKLLFSDPVEGLKKLWLGILGGYSSLIDLLFWPIDKAINLVGGWFGWTDPEEPFSLKTFLHGKIKDGIKWVGKLFGFDEKEINKLLDFSLTDFLFGPTGVVTKTVGFIKGMFEGVSKFFKDLFGTEEGDDVGIDISKLFGGLDFEMPDMKNITENILAQVGEKLNNAMQGIAKKVFDVMPGFADINAKLAGLFADGGVSIAEMMGAKNISKFNVGSGGMDVLKTEPTRPPGGALKGTGGAGAGGGTNVVTDASSQTNVNQSNNSSYVASLSPHHPARSATGSYF